MKKVILIRANYFLNKQAQPLGLAYLGAVLIQNGWQVRLIDAAPLDYQDSQILEELRWRKPQIVCLTSTTPEFPIVVKLAQKIKKKYNLPIVIGGPHVSAAPKLTLKFSCFDFAVIGEAEKTLPLLLETIIKTKKDLQKIKGIGFKKRNKITLTAPQQLIKKLDSIPFPARHLLPDFKKYSPLPSTYKCFPVATIITSRGCPFRCIFCDHSIFGWQARFRSPKNVVEEMEILTKNYGIKELRIWDDTFNLQPKRVIDICKLMIKQKLNLSWTCQARVNFINKRLLSWMKKSGCWQISFGIESGSEKILKLLQKGITKEMVKKAVKLTKEANIETKGFFMVGLPKETKKDIQQTINFALKLPLDYAAFSIATPFIGTKLYKMLPAKKRVGLNDFKHLVTYHNPKIYFTDHLSKKQVLAFQKQAYHQFYLRPGYWLRQLKSIKSLGDFFLKIRSLAILMPNI